MMLMLQPPQAELCQTQPEDPQNTADLCRVPAPGTGLHALESAGQTRCSGW